MSKYIDADALKEGMSELLKSPWANDKSLVPRNMIIKEVLRTVKDLCIDKTPTVDVEPVRKWISVDERLPEEPYDCLAVVEETDRYTGEDYLTVFPVLVGYDGETWNDYDGEEIPFEVTAWLKVLEPPKMDGGSE